MIALTLAIRLLGLAAIPWLAPWTIIFQVFPSKYKAIVEGLNLSTKHIKPSADNPKGGIEKQESPIHISNLMLVDPSDGKPTKIYRKRNKEGKIERLSKKTNKII